MSTSHVIRNTSAHMPPADRPSFHVAPTEGWLNDPNGPFFFRGRWHLFYQYLPGSAKWDFGLMWGHAVSCDLVHWQQLPPALVPTPGGADQDGVFSGCACIDEETGIPVLLYTGVRLRSSPTCGPLPPPECDLNLPFIESQLVAFPADLDDPLLEVWIKSDVPFLSLPPPNLNLGGWRDPYIIATPSSSPDGKYCMLLSSGIKNKGGNILVYKSRHLTHGWTYEGSLCSGSGGVTGIIWECPLLAELHPHGHQLPPLESTGSDGRCLRRQLGGSFLGSGCCWPAASQAAATAAAAAAKTNSQLCSCTTPLIHPPPQISNSSSSSDVSDGGEARHHKRFFFCQSPDAPRNPTFYWLGSFCHGRCAYDIDNALGPFRLDLGDILYAPNLVIDPQGRTLLVAWLQERRKVGTYDYAGCISLPRVLSLDTSDPLHPRLIQHPLPEAIALRRSGASWVYRPGMQYAWNGDAVGFGDASGRSDAPWWSHEAAEKADFDDVRKMLEHTGGAAAAAAAAAAPGSSCHTVWGAIPDIRVLHARGGLTTQQQQQQHQQQQGPGREEQQQGADRDAVQQQQQAPGSDMQQQGPYMGLLSEAGTHTGLRPGSTQQQQQQQQQQQGDYRDLLFEADNHTGLRPGIAGQARHDGDMYIDDDESAVLQAGFTQQQQQQQQQQGLDKDVQGSEGKSTHGTAGHIQISSGGVEGDVFFKAGLFKGQEAELKQSQAQAAAEELAGVDHAAEELLGVDHVAEVLLGVDHVAEELSGVDHAASNGPFRSLVHGSQQCCALLADRQQGQLKQQQEHGQQQQQQQQAQGQRQQAQQQQQEHRQQQQQVPEQLEQLHLGLPEQQRQSHQQQQCQVGQQGPMQQWHLEAQQQQQQQQVPNHQPQEQEPYQIPPNQHPQQQQQLEGQQQQHPGWGLAALQHHQQEKQQRHSNHSPEQPSSPCSTCSTSTSQYRGHPGAGGALVVGAGQSFPVPCVMGPFLDIEICLMPSVQEAAAADADAASSSSLAGGSVGLRDDASDVSAPAATRLLQSPTAAEAQPAVGLGSLTTAEAAPAQSPTGPAQSPTATAAAPAQSPTAPTQSPTATAAAPAQSPTAAEAVPAQTPTAPAQSPTTAETPPAVGEVGSGLMSGLILRSWLSGQEGSAAVLYSWQTGRLEVVFEALDPVTHDFSLTAPDAYRVGGQLMRPPKAGEQLKLRLLLDSSLLEVYTEHGEVLSTRVYRGVQPEFESASPRAHQAPNCGVEVVSIGGDTTVVALEAHEMCSIWEPAESEAAAEQLLQQQWQEAEDAQSGSPASAAAAAQEGLGFDRGGFGVGGTCRSSPVPLWKQQPPGSFLSPSDMSQLEALLPAVLGSLLDPGFLQQQQQLERLINAGC